MIHVLEPTENYGLFHGTCEGYCSWADFTEKIFEYAGVDAKVNHITTDQYPTPAKRPAYSVLDNYMLKLTTDFTFPQWEDALKEYLAQWSRESKDEEFIYLVLILQFIFNGGTL